VAAGVVLAGGLTAAADAADRELRAPTLSLARLQTAQIHLGIPPDPVVPSPGAGPACQATLEFVDAEGRPFLTGRRWEHRGGAGRYSYYRQPYHFQALHRDVLDCELSVITCLRDDPGPGGDLLLFPGRVDEPLAQVRATPGAGMVTLRLRPGESLVFFGRAVPHAVTPVGPGRARITVPACYRAVSPAGAARGT
jgi:hypothetical protein